MDYTLGLAFGLAVGVGLVALAYKSNVLDMTFDERQELARGKAYCYGFFTLMGCLLVWGFTESAVGVWCDTLTGSALCISISMTVFAVTCIRNDAYLSLKESPRKVMMSFVLVAVANFSIGLIHVVNGTVIEDGRLTTGSVNLMFGVMMLVIMLVYLVDHCLRGREEAE